MQPESTNADLAELGRLIKRERAKTGLNISQLAEEAGVSRSWLSFLERGNHPSHGGPMRPSYTEVRKLAKPLGLAADRLSDLAGYGESHRDLLDPTYYTLGASTAKDSRSKPSLLRDLEDLEQPISLSEDLRERLATEMPSFSFLYHLAENPDMRLIGVSSVVGSDTSARLYASGENQLGADGIHFDLDKVKRIGTYGWHTVSTVALIVYLIQEKRSWELIGMDNNNVIASRTSPEAKETIKIEIAYATGALTHGLRKKHFDAIALPSLPYISDRPEFRRLRAVKDLTLPGLGDYPQTLVVTHRSMMETESERYLVLQDLDEISFYNEKASEEYRRKRPSVASRLGIGNNATEEDEDHLTLVPSGLLDEVGIYSNEDAADIADKLMGMYEIAKTIELFGKEFEPPTRQQIVESAVPLFKLFERETEN